MSAVRGFQLLTLLRVLRIKKPMTSHRGAPDRAGVQPMMVSVAGCPASFRRLTISTQSHRVSLSQLTPRNRRCTPQVARFKRPAYFVCNETVGSRLPTPRGQPLHE